MHHIEFLLILVDLDIVISGRSDHCRIYESGLVGVAWASDPYTDLIVIAFDMLRLSRCTAH